MKHLIDIINEGNIDYTERKYREFCGMCRAYGVEPDQVTVHKTQKNNWAVYVDGEKKFLVSRNILDDSIIDSKNIKRCDESLNEDDFLIETYKDKLHKYTITYLQYDPDVQEEYESAEGDVDEDDLHDSAFESDIVKPLDIGAIDDNQAKRKAEKIAKKEINKYPELCGYRLSRDGEEIDTIFI